MILLLTALLLGPPPDCGNCWLAWSDKIHHYEVWSGTTKCATLVGFQKPDGKWVNPRRVYWPYPGDGCWHSGQSALYRVRSCNETTCGPFDLPVEFGPQQFMCFTSLGRVPCEE